MERKCFESAGDDKMVERNLNIPLLYEVNETEFLHSGICSLSETVRCEVHEVMNAEFELELEYPVNGSHANDLINGRYISAFVDLQRGYNPFEIDTVEKNLFTDTFIIKASHQTNKLRKKMIKEFKVDKVSCGTAMNRLKDSLLESTNIEFYSDISTLNSTFLRFKNALSCIGGVEGSILDTWRGEIERTTNKISMLKKRGTDSGVAIAYRKNMTGLNINTDTLDMVNAIMPYAIKTVNDSDTVISLQESYIYSPNYKTGDEINAVEIDYSSDENVVDEITLRNASKNYFSSNTINEPKLDLEISFQDLGQTEEYKMFQNMNRIFIGDTLSVFHTELNIEATARMVEFTMDSLRGKYITCVVGSVKSDLKSTMTAGMATLDEIEAGDNRMQEYVDDLTNQITGNQGGNLVIRPPEKPAELLIMDTDNVGTAVNLWRFNQMGLGHSKTGYNGEYTIGLTQDGKIVADLIATGTLRAIDIEGVTITGSKVQADLFSAQFVPADGDPAPLRYKLDLAGAGMIFQAIQRSNARNYTEIQLSESGIDFRFFNNGEIRTERSTSINDLGIETPSIANTGNIYLRSENEARVVDDSDFKIPGHDGTADSYVYRSIRAKSFVQHSTVERKQDFVKYEDTEKLKATDIIKSAGVFEYRLKDDLATNSFNKKIGMLAEMLPEHLKTDGKSVDMYAVVTNLWQYARENEEEKQAMRNEIDELKELVYSLAEKE
ncbi:phage tail spike protein [Listeria monocytogenes]|uniref:phage tail spike protein n=1 Tax=Listeria monocytogenes TaxID=1639 RepID=UPI001F1D2675|nr:phage tail spike protein [Listeria monocytogenes]